MSGEAIEPSGKITLEACREIVQGQGPKIVTIWPADRYIRPADDRRACCSPAIDRGAIHPVWIFQQSSVEVDSKSSESLGGHRVRLDLGSAREMHEPRQARLRSSGWQTIPQRRPRR